MKKVIKITIILFMILCLPGFAGVIGSEDAEKPLVFIFAGQSNMEGVGDIKQIPTKVSLQPSNIHFIFNGEKMNVWEQEFFGPELLFMHLISQEYPDREIIIIKEAYRGSALVEWLPDWKKEEAVLVKSSTNKPLYNELFRTIVKYADPESVEFGGLFWMQGESDAKYKFAANEYELNLERFVDRLRLDLNNPTIPLILGQINPPKKGFPESKQVIDAQIESELLISYSKIISSYGITKFPDRLHYDTLGQVRLGERFFYAYKELQNELPF